jgi:hypothetical protein
MSLDRVRNSFQRVGPRIAAALAAAALLVPALTGGGPSPQKAKLSLADVDIPALLDKLTAYAGRLENVALDFICREEIAEKIDYTLDAVASSPLVDTRTWSFGAGIGAGTRTVVDGRRPKVTKNSYVYDYQCIRKDRIIRESRTLLEENKAKKNELNATLKTAVFVYGNALFGPVGIFAPRFRPLYDYALAGPEEIDKKPVVIVEAFPKADSPDLRLLYGKAWVDPVTADILKIEWSEKRVGRLDIFQERADRYKLKPRITIRSEMRTASSGIRFPNFLVLEEAYLNDRGRAVVRSETTVTYKDFKFFTVEVEVR